jgi:hypothetical protein
MSIKTVKDKRRAYRVQAEIFNQQILLRIGEMCVAWAALEYVLFRLFYFMSGLPTPVARSLFYSQTTNLGRINLLHATYTPLLTKNYRPLATVKKIKKYLDGLAPLANERNNFIHDPWANLEGDRRKIVQFGLKSKTSHGQIRPMKAREIAALKKKIDRAGRRAVKLTRALAPQFEASRKRLLQDPDITLLWSNRPPQTAPVPRKRRPRTPTSRATR